MTPVSAQEIAANLERAEQSIRAARDLALKDCHDFAASRAYYAALARPARPPSSRTPRFTPAILGACG